MITCLNVFNVSPKTTLLPLWPRDVKRLDTPGRVTLQPTEPHGLGLSRVFKNSSACSIPEFLLSQKQ